jgi:hypothetical protein
MPDTKISADSAATNLTGLELAGIQGGANVRVPVSLFGGALSVPTGTINGSNTVFTLASTPNGDILVFLNGLTVLKSTYTVVGTTLTFTTAPETGDALQVLIGAAVGASPPTLAVLTFASTLGIAFTVAPQRRSLALTGNITFTGSGYTDTREVKIFVAGDTVARTLAFPAGWVFVGTKPTEQPANKAAIFSLECTSGVEAGVRCAWGVQP